MKKHTKAMFSLFLALCMLLSGLPWAPTVVAVESENIPNVAIENEDAPLNNEITIVEEDISLRGEYEKHFLMSDGTYQAVVYSSPVHELVDGIWVEIENANPNARGSVTTDNAKQNIIDNYVLQGAGVQDKSKDRLYIGNRSAGLTRAFIRFATMPTLPSGAVITDATMTLHLTSTTSTAENASAYQVTGGQWASGEIQWSNKPAADILLQANISHNNCTGYTFSCLTAVQHWYTGDATGQHENYGIMLRYYDESIDDYNAVYSADHTEASLRPSLTITYQPPNSILYLDEGQTMGLAVSGNTGAITWTSSNPAVATVDANGTVTGVKVGHTTITAYDDDLEYRTYSVHVTLANGVYYIKSVSRDLYLGTDGSTTNSASVQLYEHADNGDAQLRQLWKITYLGDGYYTIRPMYNRGMTLHAAGTIGSSVDTISGINGDTLSSVPLTSRWGITSSSNGDNYYLNHIGTSSLSLKGPESTSSDVNVATAVNSSMSNCFEWDLVCVAHHVIKLDVIYDYAYLNRYPNAINRIQSQIDTLHQKYLSEFNVWIDCDPPEVFASYADTQCTTTPTQTCTHATDQECKNSALYTSGSTTLQTHHHNNIYNIMLRIPFPDLSQSVRMAYIGHEICKSRQEVGDENKNGIYNELLHIHNPYWGLTYRSIGLITITNTYSVLSEAKTMIHEFGHLYQAPDHYGKDSGDIPSTADMQKNDPRFNSYCIYGENRMDSDVLENMTICEGCKARIKQNLSLYNH